MPGGFYLEGKTQKLSLESLLDRLEELEAKIDGIKTQTDKLAGELPIIGSSMEDWQIAEADVVSIGAAGVRYKLHSLVVFIDNLVGPAITIRMFMQKSGTEVKVYDQSFDATSDPLGLWLVNGTVEIDNVLRITLQSNNPADNGKTVDYRYLVEAM